MRPSFNQAAADAIVAIHLFIGLFALAGGVLVWHNVRWAWIHAPVAVWMVFVNVADWTCPLTTYENYFRNSSAGGFVERYSRKFFTQKFTGRQLEIAVGTVIAVVNGCVYLVIFLRNHRA